MSSGLLPPIAFSRIFHLTEYGNWLGREERRGNWSTNGIEERWMKCAWIVIFLCLCLCLSVSNIIQSLSDKSASAAEIDIIAVVLAGRSPILSRSQANPLPPWLVSKSCSRAVFRQKARKRRNQEWEHPDRDKYACALGDFRQKENAFSFSFSY